MTDDHARPAYAQIHDDEKGATAAGVLERANTSPWNSNHDRAEAVPAWLDYSNLDRSHLGAEGRTPIDRITNGRDRHL